MRNLKPIMLVEDDDVDVMTTKRALKDLKIANTLVHSFNGEQALEYLRGQGNEKPCVILLDLNMPKMNGLEFLNVLKANKALKNIPVVILTISRDEEDIVKGFKLGVAGYMVKPTDYEKFVEAIRAIDLYWTLSELPNEN